MSVKNIAVIVLLSIPGLIFGQGQFEGGLEFGIMGTQVDGDTLSGYDKAGLRLGGYIERPILEKWAFQMGIIYAQKGSKQQRDENNIPSTFYAIRLHYFDIPFTGRYYHKSGFFFETGISIGYLFKSKEEGVTDSIQYASTEDYGFNKLEFSWHLGAGYRLFPRTYIHTQFGYSITKIRGKYDSPVWGIRPGQYNNTLMISLQVYLGKRD